MSRQTRLTEKTKRKMGDKEQWESVDVSQVTLEERACIIQAYDCKTMYPKMAKLFNCSCEQIKRIIANRADIMKLYVATKNIEKDANSDQNEIRQRKISFLGECMYEYFQRVRFHHKITPTEKSIRDKALTVRDVIQIENFAPNKKWFNDFKARNDFNLTLREMSLFRTLPASLDLIDITAYCARRKTKVDKNIIFRTIAKITTETIEISSEKKETERKISLLETALYEYMQRSQYYHKVTFNEDLLKEVAYVLKGMLKIENFVPNKSWFNHFKNRFDFRLSQGIILMSRIPPQSLNLKDILNYCSRRETESQIRASVETRAEIINLVDDECDQMAKPELENTECQPPLLKINKIESAAAVVEKTAPSLEHCTEQSNKEDDDESPVKVQSYKQALKLLKSLEEFAAIKENYRGIGLISQLEEVFKNPNNSLNNN